MMPKPFTKAQKLAISIMRSHGRLERYPGGQWSRPDQGGSAFSPTAYVGTATVQALYNARLADVPQWNYGMHRAKMFAYPTDKLMERVTREEREELRKRETA